MSLIVNDDNYLDVIAHAEKNGFSTGALPRKTAIGELACAAVYAEHSDLIPESQWRDRIKEMTAAGAFIGQRWKSDTKADNQSSENFCWSYSLCQAMMAKRVALKLPFVQLSAESLAEDVNYRNAGNSLDSALEYASKYGIATRATVPQYQLNPRQWKPEYKVERAKYMPIEWFDLGGKNVWAETVTALLSGDGCYVGYDWASHAVFLDMLVVDASGKIGVHTPNSWGAGQDWTLFGSKAVPSMGSFVIRSVTYG